MNEEDKFEARPPPNRGKLLEDLAKDDAQLLDEVDKAVKRGKK